ncbi:MAG: ABC transporter permease [Nitrospirota bacterium]
MSGWLQETTALTRRWFQRLMRERMTLVFGLFQPMLWLILFGSSFKNATLPQAFGTENYFAFMTAGVVVMTVLNSGLAGGVDLIFDRETGFLDRLLVAPIARSSIIVSRFLFVMALSGLQILIILGTAWLLDVAPATGLSGVAVILLVGVLLGVGLTALSLGLAFSISSHSGFFSLIGFITLPLIFVSSALVSLDAMPVWLRAVAAINPMTWTIDAVRSLILQGWFWPRLLVIIAALLVFDAGCVALSSRVLRRTLG